MLPSRRSHPAAWSRLSSSRGSKPLARRARRRIRRGRSEVGLDRQGRSRGASGCSRPAVADGLRPVAPAALPPRRHSGSSAERATPSSARKPCAVSSARHSRSACQRSECRPGSGAMRPSPARRRASHPAENGQHHLVAAGGEIAARLMKQSAVGQRVFARRARVGGKALKPAARPACARPGDLQRLRCKVARPSRTPARKGKSVRRRTRRPAAANDAGPWPIPARTASYRTASLKRRGRQSYGPGSRAGSMSWAAPSVRAAMSRLARRSHGEAAGGRTARRCRPRPSRHRTRVRSRSPLTWSRKDASSAGHRLERRAGAKVVRARLDAASDLRSVAPRASTRQQVASWARRCRPGSAAAPRWRDRSASCPERPQPDQAGGFVDERRQDDDRVVVPRAFDNAAEQAGQRVEVGKDERSICGSS